MKEYGYGYDSDMDYEEEYREDMGTDGKRPMLDHVIALLKALIGILDIISDSFEKRR
ncbi:MAG: hypothetical protein MR663_14250 [Lachnospiraceae bacterium]|nr:hypothetical protein [Lachnospiraceae bacterium]MCI6205010.1 hypothetical protein [Lachnospiraceae bacterium]